MRFFLLLLALSVAPRPHAHRKTTTTQEPYKLVDCTRIKTKKNCVGWADKAHTSMCVWSVPDRLCVGVELIDYDGICGQYARASGCEKDLRCAWDNGDRECTEGGFTGRIPAGENDPVYPPYDAEYEAANEPLVDEVDPYAAEGAETTVAADAEAAADTYYNDQYTDGGETELAVPTQSPSIQPSGLPTSTVDGMVVKSRFGPCVPLRYVDGDVYKLNPSGTSTHGKKPAPHKPHKPKTTTSTTTTADPQEEYVYDEGYNYNDYYVDEVTAIPTNAPTNPKPTQINCARRKKDHCNDVQAGGEQVCRWNLEIDTCTMGFPCDPFFVCGTYTENECSSDYCRWDFIVNKCISKYAPADEDECTGKLQSQCNGHEAQEGKTCRWNLMTSQCTSGYECNPHFVCPTYNSKTCPNDLCKLNGESCVAKHPRIVHHKHHKKRSAAPVVILATFYGREHETDCKTYCDQKEACTMCELDNGKFSVAKGLARMLSASKKMLQETQEESVREFPVVAGFVIFMFSLFLVTICGYWIHAKCVEREAKRNPLITNV